MKPLSILAASAYLMVLATASVEAQQGTPSQRASEVARSLRQKGESGDATRFLTQASETAPRAVLDALADSLAVIAVENDGDDPNKAKVQRAAIRALSSAGMGLIGKPYAGAAPRLLQVVQRAPVGAGGALWALSQLPDRAVSIQSVRRVAVSKLQIAYAAVGHMARDMGPDGLSALKTLYENDLVVESQARAEIDRQAEVHGWRRSPRRR